MDEGPPNRSIASRLKQFFKKNSLSAEQFEEEIQDLLDHGAETGVITAGEGAMIQSIVEFGDTAAREIMTPRTAIAGIPKNIPLEEVIKTVLAHGFSRLPVYGNDIDHIEGVLMAKDLLALWGTAGDELLPKDIIRAPYFVPGSKKIDELLGELRHHKSHMAFVLDEYGGIAGLITMEDIVEEIVGDIYDEFDTQLEPIKQLDTQTWLSNAQFSIYDLAEHLKIELPNGDYETIGGFVISLIGRVPKIDEEIIWKNLLFTIIKADERKIHQLKITKNAEHQTEMEKN